MHATAHPVAGSDPSRRSDSDSSMPSDIRVDIAPAKSFHSSAGMNITLKDVRFSLPSNQDKSKEAVLLQGVHAVFAPGQMTALMGPSGSGKTTLLDILAGRKTSGTVGGTITFGGVTPTPAFLRRYTGYVEQFDTLIPELTVFQMLMYTAELKRPREEAYESKRAAVEALIEKLELTSCRDVQIGSNLAKGVSGGQAKRVNIGIALITEPRVLFLDEPTSGLDSSTANGVMSVVRNIANEGTTIVCTIHSPTAYSFDLFDNVMVLAKGRMAYSGGNGKALDAFLESILPEAQKGVPIPNRAEALIDNITEADRQGLAGQMAEAFAASPAGEAARGEVLKRAASKHELSQQQQSELATRRATVTPSWWALLVLLRYRTAMNYRSVAYVAPRFADKIFVGVLVLALYWQIGKDFVYSNINAQTAMLFMWVTLPAFGATAYMPSIVLERALFVRERNDGLYRVITYLTWKMIDELMMALVATLGVSTFVWFGVGLQGSFAVFWLVYFVTLSIGIVLAYLIASVAPNMEAANAMLPTYVVTLLYFGGLLITFDAMPGWLRWYSYVDFVRYGWGALMKNQFGTVNPAWVGGTTVLGFFGFDSINEWAYIGYEIIFFAVFFLLAWAGLSFKKVSSR